MHFRSLLPVHFPSRRVSLGLSVIALASMLGSSGCMDYSLTGVFIEPSAGACLYPDPSGSAQFHAYGTYTKGGHSTEVKDITTKVTWSVDLPGMAIVSSSGLVTPTGNEVGQTNVYARTEGEFGLIQSSALVKVITTCVSSTGAIRTLSGLHVLPGDQSLLTGDTSQLMAIGHFSIAPFSDDLTGHVVWTSSNPQVAKVSGAGFVTAMGEGDAVITATKTTANGQVVTSSEKIHVGQ